MTYQNMSCLAQKLSKSKSGVEVRSRSQESESESGVGIRSRSQESESGVGSRSQVSHSDFRYFKFVLREDNKVKV